ncbi:MAG: S-layer homology domain-containing protein, partial [Oscillospiraceae bacterium]
VELTDEYATYIETAYQNGIVSLSGSGKFRPDENVAASEFLKMVIHTCGYGKYLEYNDCLRFANQHNLLVGTGDIKAEDYVSMNIAIAILSNALELDLMVQTGIDADGNGIYNVSKGENILKHVYEIKKIRGLVTANSKTSIYSEDNNVSGVKINDTVYKCKAEYETFLGYFVNAYVSIKNDEVIYLTPSNKTEVLRLKGDDILDESTKQTIKYYNENGNIITGKIKNNASYFLNDVYYANMESNIVTNETFKDSNSVFCFVDYDGGGYDFVFEEQYTYFQVKSVDIEDLLIIEKDKNSGIEIIKEDVFKYSDGKIISINDLKYNDILGVKVSKDFEFKERTDGIEFLVLQNVVRGKATKSDEKSVRINSNTYRLNGISAESIDNKEGSFYLDANERIVAYDSSKLNTGSTYMYISKIEKVNGALGSISARVLDPNDGLCMKTFADKAHVYSGEKQLCNNSKKLFDIKTSLENKIVKVTFSDDGKIKRIDLPKKLNYGEKGQAGDFNYISATKYRKRGDDIFNDLYQVPKNATAFVVPINHADTEIYSVRTVEGISMYEDIEMEFYSVNNAYRVDCVLVKEKDASSGPVSAEGSIFVVDQLAKSLTDDGDTTITAYGMYNGEYKSFKFIEEDSKAKTFNDNKDIYGAVKRKMVASDISCGDVLLLNLDGSTISSYRVLLDASDDPDFARQGSDDWDDVADWPIDYPFVNKAMLLTNGVLKNREDDTLTYEMNIPSKGIYTKNSFLSNLQHVYVVDMKEGKVFNSKINSSDITMESKIFT